MANSQGQHLLSGSKTVAAAGTAERLVAASRRARSVVIVAKDNNTGRVYLGGPDVDSNTNRGLAASDMLPLTAAGAWMDLREVWIDSGVNGEGVDFYAVLA